MSLLKTIRQQLGLSVTPTNNFTLDASADNGTMKLARGNAGATTQDILTVDASGNVTAPQNFNVTGDITEGGSPVPRMVLGTTQNSTSGTSIDFTGIPSWAKRITVMFSGVSTTGSSHWLIQLGTSGGMENTGYLGTSFDSVTITNYTTGFGIRVQSAGSVVHGHVVINTIGSNNWTASGVLGRSDAAGWHSTGGSKALSGVLERIRITTVNGTDTFDAGSVNILYEG